MPEAETTPPPEYVAKLQAAYGAPSQEAFGSAVFYEPQIGNGDLASVALDKYKYFVGDLWARYGEDVWLGHWRQVYARPVEATPDIVAELRTVDDHDAALSIPMILDNIDEAERAQAALAAAFDDPTMREVAVFNLGDGEALSGLLIAGRRPETGEALFRVFLLD